MPEVPISIASVVLTGRYIRPDGTPLTGTVTFEPPAHLTFSDADIISFGSATVALDSTGSFSVSLIATDAAGGDPSNWTYTVVERLHQATGRTFPIALPSATPIVDMADIAPTDPSQGDYVVVTGPAGRDGSQIYSGTGAPSNTLGVNGDFYIDTTPTAVTLYGPKSASAWQSTGVLLGNVLSVNGKNGVVVLTPADIGALALSGGSLTGSIALDVAQQINVGGSTSSASLAVQRANGSDVAVSVRLPGNTVGRFTVGADGLHQWSSGSAVADVSLNRGASNRLDLTTADLRIGTAGRGLMVAEGTNAKMGTATLVAGTVTVSTTSVTSNSRIFLTAQNTGGAPGALRVASRTAGTSFVITSTSTTDTSAVAWMIVEPA